MAETRLRSTRCNHRLIVADGQGIEKLSDILSASFPSWPHPALPGEATDEGHLVAEVEAGGAMPFDGGELVEAVETTRRILSACLPGSFVEVFDPDGFRFGRLFRLEGSVEERWCDMLNPFENGGCALHGTVLPAGIMPKISALLEARGIETIDEAWRDPSTGDFIGLVAKDRTGGAPCLVFVQLLYSEARLPREDAESARSALEAAAASWLSGNPEMADVRVRFDVFAVAKVGDGRAIVRHYVNALGL